MIRSNKKIKLNDAAKSGYVQSGNFMTSYLHDQTEYTDEMPIASPDALNNEVPVNTINPENEEEINNETKDTGSINSMETNVNNSKLIPDQTKMSNSNISNRSIYRRNDLVVKQNGTISGGLTLDKTNKSLKNLIYYIKTAYSNSLTSPKWKNFKGLKLQVIEKIRLNNVIWRTWFEQYGTKHPNKKKQRPLLCQFAITLEEPIAPARVALLEGEYWKRRLCSITNEYKKWREISRKQIKSTNDGNIQVDQTNQTIKNYNNNKSKISLINSISSNSLNHANYSNTNNYCDQNQQTGFNNNSNNQFDYLNNSHTFYDTNYSNSNILNNNLNYNPQQNYYNNNLNSGSLTSNLINNNSNNNYHQISSKQIPFTNRCRSPSPGLFQDFDLYNFSSDTLFSTYCFEDQKDPIFGTNPDLFQPDLMHLYPNFDFLDLDLISDGYSSNNNLNNYDSGPISRQINQSFNSKVVNQVQPIESQQAVVLTNNVSSTNQINNSNSNDMPIYIQPNETSQNQQSISLQSKQISVLDSLTANSSSASLSSTSSSSSANLVQQQTYITTESSDLYNFNTLVSVAAAQSPNGEINRKNNFIKSNNMSGKNLKQTNVSNDNSSSLMNQIKMSNSMPQMSTENSLVLQQNDKLNNANNTVSSLVRMNSLNQSSSINGPSNTIRNLLALQTPIIPLNNNNSNNVSNSNIRISTGVLSAVGGTLPNGQSTSRQNSYSSTNINSLISNMHKQSTSTSSSPPSSISSPTTTTSPNLLDSNMKYQQQDNQQISALLSVVLAAPSSNNSNNTVLNTQDTITNDLLARQNKINSEQSSGPKPKRGRKPSNSITVDLMNEKNFENRNLLNFSNKPIQQPQQNLPLSLSSSLSLIKGMEGTKTKKEKPSKINQSKFPKQNQFNDLNTNKPSFYLQNYTNDNQLCNNNSNTQVGLMINERNSSSNSPVDSPNNNSNSSFYNQSNGINNMAIGNYNLISGAQNMEMINDFNSNIMHRVNSNSSLSHVASTSSMKLPATLVTNMNNEMNNAASGSRTLSRSNSVNSINTMNEQISTAEQKRRCNIQHGFDRLQTLVPSLRESKNSKASKAAMLCKTSEYIKELQRARQKRMGDLEVYKKEIEQLSDQISDCQNELPANGVSVVGNLNKTEKFEQKFKEYVKERTVDNWRFYLFSIILKPLFDNFIKTLNTSSKEDMERTFYEWQEKFCNLVQLRPIISNGLRQLSKSTSILTDSSKLPEECYTAALTKI